MIVFIPNTVAYLLIVIWSFYLLFEQSNIKITARKDFLITHGLHFLRVRMIAFNIRFLFKLDPF